MEACARFCRCFGETRAGDRNRPNQPAVTDFCITPWGKPMEIHERPHRVAGERVWRTWPGGRELDRLHGVPEPRDGSFPEEWMLSTTRANNIGREDIEEGICYLVDAPEKTSLKHLLETRPREMLGGAHVDRWGATPGFLVKIIDAQSRLQLQAHPDKPTAKRLFDSDYGKTECWHILALRDDGDAEPCLYLGFRPGVRESDWRDCFERQDSEGMLAMLNRVVPRPGETYIVHGGAPHAIGGGCFLVEIQEPTDLTIRLEKKMPYGPPIPDAACHQGLGFDRMFECFVYEGKSDEEVLRDWRLAPRPIDEGDGWRVESLVDYGTTECFRMDRLSVGGAMRLEADGLFSGLYVKAGRGALEMPGLSIPLEPNDQLFVPASCRSFDIVADGGVELELLRFFGPKIS